MKSVTVHTDGSCLGNPGVGGWCAILEYKSSRKTIRGHEENTTNNRMELTAVIAALEILKEPCSVTIVTDSKYVLDPITKGWLQEWGNNGWIKSNKKPVANADLWKRVSNLLATQTVKMEWVKGHSGDSKNELCDQIARVESTTIR